jgi:O-antigen/teichoic acid export membrane protein
MRTRTEWLADVRWAIRWTMPVAIVFSAYAVAQRLIAGAGSFDQYHMTVGSLVAVYLCGGAVTGAIVGFLRPLVRYPVGAFFVGFVAAFPVMLVLWMFVRDRRPWDDFDALVLVTTCLCFGALPALYWSQPSNKR